MKKILLPALLLFFSLSVYAQQPSETLIPKPNTPRPNTTTLSVDESKQLKDAFELAGKANADAQAAQERLAARQAEAKALYWQFIVLKKIDIEKWDFSGFDEKGIATFVEKQTKEGNKDGSASKSN